MTWRALSISPYQWEAVCWALLTLGGSPGPNLLRLLGAGAYARPLFTST